MIRLTSKDYIWSYIGVFFAACSYIIMTPFALYYLDSDMYGLWGVFESLAAVTVLFDFGFSTTFARNINYCWSGANELKKTGVAFSNQSEPNFALMKKTMLACRYVFLIISMFAVLLMGVIGTIYIRYICREIHNEHYMIAWICYLIAIFLNLYYGYYDAFLRGVGAIFLTNKARVIGRAVQIILSITLLSMKVGIVAMSMAYLSYGFIIRALCKKYFYDYKNLKANLNCVEENMSNGEIRKLFIIVWHNASKEGLVTLANYLSNQSCTLICSLFLPLSITGVYSLAAQLSMALANFSSVVYSANHPVLQSAYISKDEEKTRSTMSLIVVSFIGMYLLGSIIIIVGIPFIEIIKPGMEVPVRLMIGALVYQFLLKFRNCYTSYFSSTNRIIYMKAFIISSILCVVLAYLGLGVFKIGIYSLIIAQITSQIILNSWYWPIKAHKEMKLSAIEMTNLGLIEIRNILLDFKKKNH